MTYDEIVEFVIKQLKLGINDINKITDSYLIFLSSRWKVIICIDIYIGLFCEYIYYRWLREKKGIWYFLWFSNILFVCMFTDIIYKGR